MLAYFKHHVNTATQNEKNGEDMSQSPKQGGNHKTEIQRAQTMTEVSTLIEASFEPAFTYNGYSLIIWTPDPYDKALPG